ncbi:MAG TPA: ATP-binding protein [Solirubrobacteraceae bacterium]|nr:ATP-binding protein [Solirubrobacteraceae bacterium]
MSRVKLELESRPEALVLVRGVLMGVGDFLGFDPELLHNLKAVVSEACNNVVQHAYDGAPGPLAVELEIIPDGVQVRVRDWGCGLRHVAPSEDRMHVGLAVISALADHAQFAHAAGGGTEVRMGFTRRPGIRILAASTHGGASESASVDLSGDAIARLSPVGLLDGVLTRVATALAASAHFSLDRFCDVYLITDTVAAHAEASAIGDRLGLAVAAQDRRLELTVGPFRAGSGLELDAAGAERPFGSALSLLAVELDVEPVAGAEIWRLVVLDRSGAASP